MSNIILSSMTMPEIEQALHLWIEGDHYISRDQWCKLAARPDISKLILSSCFTTLWKEGELWRNLDVMSDEFFIDQYSTKAWTCCHHSLTSPCDRDIIPAFQKMSFNKLIVILRYCMHQGNRLLVQSMERLLPKILSRDDTHENMDRLCDSIPIQMLKTVSSPHHIILCMRKHVELGANPLHLAISNVCRLSWDPLETEYNAYLSWDDFFSNIGLFPMECVFRVKHPVWDSSQIKHEFAPRVPEEIQAEILLRLVGDKFQ